jgi:hypothetical protein
LSSFCLRLSATQRRRLTRANVFNTGSDFALCDFDPLANFALLVRLQQAALADVLEIDAHEVDIFPRDARLSCLAGLLIVFNVFNVALRDRLVGVRFRLVIVDEACRFLIRPTWIGLLATVDGQAKFLSPLTPVEHVGLPRRVGPLDKRRSRTAAAAWLERESIRARRFLRH